MQQTCAGLTTDIENTASTFLIGSTITLYLTVTINLSPIDSQGSFIPALQRWDSIAPRKCYI